MGKFRMTLAPDSLYQLAEVEVCKMLWTHSQIRNSIKVNGFQELHKIYKGSIHRRWDTDDKILNQVFRNVGSLSLPLAVKHNLKIQAKKTGVVIWNFKNRVYRNLSLYINWKNCIDHIKWTKYGDVDLANTVRSMYNSGILPDAHRTWLALTTCCLEDCITDYFARNPTMDDSNYLRFVKPSMYVLQKYWRLRMQNNLQHFETSDFVSNFINSRGFDSSKSWEWKLLASVVLDRNESATEYFLKFLRDDEKISVVESVGSRINNAKIAVLLWRHALVCGADNFFMNILRRWDVISQLKIWPYDKLLIGTLQESWPQLNDDDLWQIVNATVIILSTVNPWEVVLAEYQLIFLEAWRRISPESKKSIDQFLSINRFFKHPEFLQHIINDPSLESRRDEFIRKLTFAYKGQIPKPWNDIEGRIENICKLVLKSEEERAEFRREISYPYHFH